MYFFNTVLSKDEMGNLVGAINEHRLIIPNDTIRLFAGETLPLRSVDCISMSNSSISFNFNHGSSPKEELYRIAVEEYSYTRGIRRIFEDPFFNGEL